MVILSPRGRGIEARGAYCLPILHASFNARKVYQDSFRLSSVAVSSAGQLPGSPAYLSTFRTGDHSTYPEVTLDMPKVCSICGKKIKDSDASLEFGVDRITLDSYHTTCFNDMLSPKRPLCPPKK